jgi:hypothetical protein
VTGRGPRERGEPRAPHLGRGRKAVLVEVIAIVENEQDLDPERLEGIEEAVPDPEVVPSGLGLDRTPRQVDSNPTDPRGGDRISLLVGVPVKLDVDTEVVVGSRGRAEDRKGQDQAREEERARHHRHQGEKQKKGDVDTSRHRVPASEVLFERDAAKGEHHRKLRDQQESERE